MALVICIFCVTRHSRQLLHIIRTVEHMHLLLVSLVVAIAAP